MGGMYGDYWDNLSFIVSKTRMMLCSKNVVVFNRYGADFSRIQKSVRQIGLDQISHGFRDPSKALSKALLGSQVALFLSLFTKHCVVSS